MPMDVYRAGNDSYHVEADLPGVAPDSVEVTVEHSTLTILPLIQPPAHHHRPATIRAPCRPIRAAS